jgi:AcrR family transcriptional regulator
LPKVALSAELILSTALRVVDDEGLDALTMRHLAEEIGVATMSLYTHVATKEEVLQGVLNLVAAEIPMPAPGMAPWDALRAVNRGFRQTAMRHPNLVPLIMRQPPAGADSLVTLDTALDALRRAGIDVARTAAAYRLMASFAIGFVSLECGGYFRPVDVGAPVDLGPVARVAEAAPYLASWDADAEFEAGMDALIGVLTTWAGSGAAAEVVEGDSSGGGHVEGVDAGDHADADPAVGRGQGAGGQARALGAHQ